MKAMILAAGLGTRLRPYSTYRPKPLFPVLGKPLLLHLLAQLRRQGFQEFVVNSHFLNEQFCEILGGEKDVSLQLEEDILGTGGGLRQARSLLGQEPFLLVNGDILHSLDLAAIYNHHLASAAPVSMVVHDRPRFNNLRVTANGQVTGLRVCEQDITPASGDRLLAFAGIHVIDPTILANIPGSGFYDIIDLYQKMIKTGVMINAIEVADHFWTDIGTPQDYLDLHKALLTDPLLAAAVGLDSVVTPVAVAAGVVLGRDVKFNDWAFVGTGARIGDGARISHSVIWAGAVVREGALIEDEIVVG
ncbi:MAG: NDP-sugar synthase [Thermodesulfobacteriota bacterium]